MAVHTNTSHSFKDNFSKNVQSATCSGIKFAWGISDWTPKFSLTFIKVFTKQEGASRLCRGLVVGPQNTVLLLSKYVLRLELKGLHITITMNFCVTDFIDIHKLKSLIYFQNAMLLRKAWTTCELAF